MSFWFFKEEDHFEQVLLQQVLKRHLPGAGGFVFFRCGRRIPGALVDMFYGV